MVQAAAVYHKARKRFGQNFLHNDGVIQSIIDSVNPKEADKLVEIGPGHGALTEGLITKGNELDVVELDRDLIPALKLRFGLHPLFRIHEADALNFNFRLLKTDDRYLRLVGNLPYNIATPLIFHLLSFKELIGDMHFMLQKEVAQRIAAKEGGQGYGRLSIMTQYYCGVEYLFNIGPESFRPMPKVDSAIVRLIPHTKLPHPCESVETLEIVVREAFGQRRKTVKNTLKNYITANDLLGYGIDPRSRPEQLSLAQFVKIASHVYSTNN